MVFNLGRIQIVNPLWIDHILSKFKSLEHGMHFLWNTSEHLVELASSRKVWKTLFLVPQRA